MIFSDFNFVSLDLPSYKEDAVREDIIAPILRQLGYSATGSARMERSKKLIHPFVKIGSQNTPIHIIPDYTLYWEQKALLVLEAKAPTEKIVKSRHAEQAFSYAIHPEIRAPFYALCNGRHLVVHSVSAWEPILFLPVQEVDKRWKEVKEALHPRFLLQPELREFQADYGMTLLKSGVRVDSLVIVPKAYWQFVCRVEDDLYTACAGCMHGDIDCLMSFDFDKNILDLILSSLSDAVASNIAAALKRQPYHIALDGKVVVGCSGSLGRPKRGEHEEFVPIVISQITKSTFDPEIELTNKKRAQQ